MDVDTDVPKSQRSNGDDSNFRHLTRIDPLNYSKDRVQWLWDKLHEHPWSFSDNTRERGDIFATSLFMPNSEHYELLDGKGYVAVHSIEYKVNAIIHWQAWEQVEVRKVLAAAHELISHLFETYALNRVTAVVPVYNKQAVRFNTLLGFKYEGTLRQAVLMNEKYSDVTLYGLLRKDFYKKGVSV